MKNILTEQMAKEMSWDGESYELDGKTYYLLTQPWLDNHYFMTDAVRVGDKIDDGDVDTHYLKWNCLTPKELGYRICDSTAVKDHDAPSGFYTLDDYSEMFGCVNVLDDGSYIPIEKPVTDREEEPYITSCFAMRLGDELDDDGDIRVYQVSFFKPDDEIKFGEIRHGDDERQVVFFNSEKFVLNDCDVCGYKRFYDNDWYVEDENACDWNHPSSVTECVGYIQVPVNTEYESKKFGLKLPNHSTR